MSTTIEHVDTWADFNGVWAILRVIVNGREKTQIVKIA